MSSIASHDRYNDEKKKFWSFIIAVIVSSVTSSVLYVHWVISERNNNSSNNDNPSSCQTPDPTSVPDSTEDSYYYSGFDEETPIPEEKGPTYLDWQSYNGPMVTGTKSVSYRILVEKGPTHFRQALENCQALDSNIAAIVSQDELNFIKNVVWPASELPGGEYFQNNYWIGLTDIKDEGNWAWYEQENYKLRADFTNWDTEWGQPDNSMSEPITEYAYIPERDQCVLAMGYPPEKVGQWHDAPCSDDLYKNYALCEKREWATTEWLPYNGPMSGTTNSLSYRLLMEFPRMNYADASLTCQELGGSLASITSQEEQDFVNNVVWPASGAVESTVQPPDGWWPWIVLGMSDLLEMGTYYWDKGENLGQGTIDGYSNWDETSDVYTEDFSYWSDQDTNSCAYFNPSEAKFGKWVPISCEMSGFALCQKRT